MLQIEKAKAEDMETIAGFIKSSAHMYEPFIDPKDLPEHRPGKKWMEENFKKRDFYIAKAPCETEVGTISMQFFGEVAYLGYIYLDVSQSGKGYGRYLIDHARDVCRKKGMKKMCLIAHPQATWAIKAYKRYGFKLIHKNKKQILQYNNGFMKPYYEEGFYLFEYTL